VDVCPFDALFWSPEFEYSEYDIRDLTHERDRLRDWMWTVPAPPAVDPLAEEPKEVTSARRAAEKAGPRPDRQGSSPAENAAAEEGPA
jgi:NADH-quinone oxidoreductase subunit I